jgi:hypothetical protein
MMRCKCTVQCYITLSPALVWGITELFFRGSTMEALEHDQSDIVNSRLTQFMAVTRTKTIYAVEKKREEKRKNT